MDKTGVNLALLGSATLKLPFVNDRSWPITVAQAPKMTHRFRPQSSRDQRRTSGVTSVSDVLVRSGAQPGAFKYQIGH